MSDRLTAAVRAGRRAETALNERDDAPAVPIPVTEVVEMCGAVAAVHCDGVTSGPVERSTRWASRSGGRDFEETAAVSGLVLLGLWCVVGGAVGAVIGQRSGRLGLGLVLGSLCGVFGWVMLAGAEPRQPVATPAPHPAEAEPSTDAVVPSFLTPVSWTVGQDDQALAASLGQS